MDKTHNLLQFLKQQTSDKNTCR